MDKFQQAVKDAASKVPKGMPNGGGGGAGKALVTGATVLLGLGALGYAASNSIVTGSIFFFLVFALTLFSPPWSCGRYIQQIWISWHPGCSGIWN